MLLLSQNISYLLEEFQGFSPLRALKLNLFQDFSKMLFGENINYMEIFILKVSLVIFLIFILEKYEGEINIHDSMLPEISTKLNGKETFIYL